MAAAATVTLQGSITGGPAGDRTIGPLTMTSVAANGSITQVVLASGDNTITVPQLPVPTGVIIKLPATNTQLTKLKKVGGDTGNEIGKVGLTMMTWDSANVPANFILNSAAAQTGLVTEIMFF